MNRSMHSPTHRQRRRDRRPAGGSPFPTSRPRRCRTSDRDRRRPSATPMRELRVELAGPPAGVAGEHAPRGGAGVVEAPGAAATATSTGTGLPGSRGTRRPPAASPIRIQPRSGSTGPPIQSGSSLPPAIGGSSLTIVRGRHLGRPVQDQPERAFLGVSRTAARRCARSSGPGAAASTAAASGGTSSMVNGSRPGRAARGQSRRRRCAGRRRSGPSPSRRCRRPAPAESTTGEPSRARAARAAIDESAALGVTLKARPSSACAATAPEADQHPRLDQRDLASRATAGTRRSRPRSASCGCAACRAAPT